MRIASLGPDNLFVANTYRQLADLYLKQALQDKAAVQLRAMMGVGTALGWAEKKPPHKKMLGAAKDLAALLRSRGAEGDAAEAQGLEEVFGLVAP